MYSVQTVSVFKIQSMNAAPFIPSPLLFSLSLSLSLSLSEIHPLCVSPPGVYEEDGQWIVQVNRLQKLIDRLEQKVTFTLPVYFSPPFSSRSRDFSVSHLTPLSISSIWSLHRSPRLTANHWEWAHANINKSPQLNNTLPRTNACTYVQCTGDVGPAQTVTAAICTC